MNTLQNLFLSNEDETLNREVKAYQEKVTSKTNEIPIWERQWLTIEEASEYSGIARRKLRELFRQVTAGRNAGIWVIGAIIIIIFPVHLKSLHLKKCIIKWPTLTRLLSLSDGHLLGGFHLLHAITAKDVHGFCGSHALVAAGANIFAGAAGLLGLGDCSVACPFGERSNYIPQADRLAHLKVLPALFLDEVQQRKSGACNRPTVFWMLLNAKPVTFGNLLILPIVVKVPGTAGIFDTFFCRKAMAHFVQKRGAGFLDWAAKCGAADVDFISPLVSCLPDFIASEMTISTHGLF